MDIKIDKDNEQFYAGEKEGKNVITPMDKNMMKENELFFALGYISGYLKNLIKSSGDIHHIGVEYGKLMIRYSLLNHISQTHALAMIEEVIKGSFDEVKDDFRAGIEEEKLA